MHCISSVLVKALTEGTWNYHIARLGAPFGMDAVDFPLGATLDFAVIKILTAIVHNPFLSINLYWLLTIAMAGAFAALFFRSLQISHLASASFAALFAITPFVFYRNIAHLTLQQFIVPAAAYLGIVLARGGVFGITENNRPSEKPNNPAENSSGPLGYLCSDRFDIRLLGVFRVHCHRYWLPDRFVPLWKKKNCTSRITLYNDYRPASVANESGSLLYWYRNGYNRAL